MPEPNDSQPAARGEGLASRYEALARIAELIRYHSDEKVLFHTCASELHQVVAFDGLSWLDPATNWVQWHFLEPYDSALEALAVRNIPKEETVAWWVYENQQPVVIPFIDRETSFPLVIERVSKLGFRSLCALPLSTAHRKLGSLVFASHLDDAYSREDPAVFIRSRESDRCRDGRCSRRPLAIAPRHHQSDRDQVGIARPASRNCCEHQTLYAM